MVRGLFGKRMTVPIGSVIKVPGIGIESRILVIPVSRAMKSIGSTFADDVNLSTLGAAKAGVVVGKADSEFIGGFHADWNNGYLVTGASNDVVSDIDAIEIECVLVAASSSNSSPGVAES